MLTAEHLAQVFNALGADRGIVYLSVPISAGPREVSLLEELGLTPSVFREQHEDRWRTEVLEPNASQASTWAAELRDRSNHPLVVDPSRLAISGWTGDDYNSFWKDIVTQYSLKVVVGSGWELSTGARHEVALAIRDGIGIEQLDGTPLPESEVFRLADSGRARVAMLGWSDTAIAGYLPDVGQVADTISLSAANQTFSWLVNEREYQLRKFGLNADDEHTREGLGEASWWSRQLDNYYGRARVLGLDIPVGRQALAKFTATACGMLESVIRVYGPLPRSGVPSGAIGESDGDSTAPN